MKICAIQKNAGSANKCQMIQNTDFFAVVVSFCHPTPRGKSFNLDHPEENNSVGWKKNHVDNRISFRDSGRRYKKNLLCWYTLISITHGGRVGFS